jgi:hypothetical protein
MAGAGGGPANGYVEEQAVLVRTPGQHERQDKLPAKAKFAWRS